MMISYNTDGVYIGWW